MITKKDIVAGSSKRYRHAERGCLRLLLFSTFTVFWQRLFLQVLQKFQIFIKFFLV